MTPVRRPSRSRYWLEKTVTLNRGGFELIRRYVRHHVLAGDISAFIGFLMLSAFRHLEDSRMSLAAVPQGPLRLSQLSAGVVYTAKVAVEIHGFRSQAVETEFLVDVPEGPYFRQVCLLTSSKHKMRRILKLLRKIPTSNFFFFRAL